MLLGFWGWFPGGVGIVFKLVVMEVFWCVIARIESRISNIDIQVASGDSIQVTTTFTTNTTTSGINLQGWVYLKLRKRNAFLEQYRRELMFADGLEDFDSDRYYLKKIITIWYPNCAIEK
jgi:hypothetical protein